MLLTQFRFGSIQIFLRGNLDKYMGEKALESNLRLFEFKTIGYYLKLFENNKAEKITVHFFSSKK